MFKKIGAVVLSTSLVLSGLSIGTVDAKPDAVDRKGKRLRRVISIDEVEGYNKTVDGIMSRVAFQWDAASDSHLFKANRNSYILEQKIAPLAGFQNAMDIYEEFDRRKHILERMLEEKIFDYYEVVQFIWTYYREGVSGLPITI